MHRDKEDEVYDDDENPDGEDHWSHDYPDEESPFYNDGDCELGKSNLNPLFRIRLGSLPSQNKPQS